MDCQDKLDYNGGDGNVPVLSVVGRTLPEAWENSVVELYKNGLRYPRAGPKDKGRKQIDSTMTIEIENPDSDLFMHKGMTCGFDSLLEYQFEILGAKDSLVVTEFDAEDDKRWPYGYHDSLANFPGRKGKIDQLGRTIEKLVNEPFMRRGNMSTWVPERDIDSKDPPCLQNIWFFLVPNGANSFVLNMNYVFRSRNVMIAAPMNMVGLYILQCYVRDQLNERADFSVKNGRIVDYTHSYHVSADNMSMLDNFISRLEKQQGAIENRAYSRDFVFEVMRDQFKGVKDKIETQIRNRFEERKSRKKNEDKVDVLDEMLERELRKLEEISEYIGRFIEWKK